MANSKKQSLGKSIIKNLVKGKDKIEEVVKSITHSSPKKTTTSKKTSTPKMTTTTKMTSTSKKTSTGRGQTKKK